MSLWYTHVNRGVIDSNRNYGKNDPPLSIKKGKRGRVTRAVRVRLPAGSEIVYSAHIPILPCGARVVVVSPSEPEIVE